MSSESSVIVGCPGCRVIHPVTFHSENSIDLLYLLDAHSRLHGDAPEHLLRVMMSVKMAAGLELDLSFVVLFDGFRIDEIQS